MPRAEPKDIIEYNARFLENQKISGWGPEGIRIHMPCPFCTASDFLVYGLLEMQDVMKKGAVCKRCGRGCRAIISKPVPEVTRMLMVQTEGANPPAWLEPWMPRFDPTIHSTPAHTFNQAGQCLRCSLFRHEVKRDQAWECI